MVCRVVCSARRNARIGMPSPCRTPSVRPPTSDRRPQGGHPCIERTRDAHGRSNVLRPLQRRFKARKKPEGYTSTPTGLKRLKTQNTAFHGNTNGKGTPSGVPQPIHKRKLILVKEEFDASSSGGAYEKNGELHQYRHPRGYPTRYLHCKGIEKLVCCRWNVPEIAISGVCKIPDGRLAVSPSNARKRGTPCQGAPLER